MGHIANSNPRSREGSDKPPMAAIAFFTNFNPRSREGSDKAAIAVEKLDAISIHAPAKGATFW